MINCVIDISHHQGAVDFRAVAAAGIVGVIHKATAGTAWTDTMYPTNRVKAMDAGLLWGAYHWGSGEPNTIAQQAAHFMEYARPDNKTLMALDFEPNVAGGHRLGPDMTAAQAIVFASEIQKARGKWPVLYTGLAMAGHFPRLPDCPLWWAGYSNAPHGIPNTWPTWTLWQYTGDGLGPQPHDVDGIHGHVDRDKFNGDIHGLRRLWGAE